MKNKAVILAGTTLVTLTLAPHIAAAQAINCSFPLLFGTAIACAGTGTITVTPSGARSTSGCVSVIPGAYSAGSCSIEAAPSSNPVQVSVAATSFTLDGPGAATMVINNFNLGTDAEGTRVTVYDVFNTVAIGARLNIQAGQTGGAYTGTYTINANYQ